jgi:hypothetical protein
MTQMGDTIMYCHCALATNGKLGIQTADKVRLDPVAVIKSTNPSRINQ